MRKKDENSKTVLGFLRTMKKRENELTQQLKEEPLSYKTARKALEIKPVFSQRTLRFLQELEEREEAMREFLRHEPESYKRARLNYDIRFIRQRMEEKKLTEAEDIGKDSCLNSAGL